MSTPRDDDSNADDKPRESNGTGVDKLYILEALQAYGDVVYSSPKVRALSLVVVDD